MRKMKMLRKSILALVLSVCMVVSPLYTSGVSIVNAAGNNLYTQDFEAVTDVKTVASSTNTPESLTISSGDATYGSYFSFANTAKINGKRGGRLEFEGIDVSSQNSYVMEFDAVIKCGSKGESAIAVMGADFAYATSGNMNSGAGSGYLLNLKGGGASSTAFTVNGDSTVTLDGNTWYHYKLYVDKNKGQVSVTIAKQDGTPVLDKYITDYNGSGNVAGLYLLLGHEYNAKIFADNIVVREVTGEDVFGSAIEATGVTLDSAAITITEGKTATLKATVTPDTTTDKTVTWSSDAENIATVDGGVVTAVSAGTANITAMTANGKTATCAVTVEAVQETGPIYLDETFEDYVASTEPIIKSGTAEVTPVEKGKLIFRAGFRSGGNNNNYVVASKDDADNTFLNVVETNYANADRGIFIDFSYLRTLPTAAQLRESRETLELSMDITANKEVLVQGFGINIPAGTDGHVRLIMDGANNMQHCIITDAEGKLASSVSQSLSDGATFSGLKFCVNGTNTKIDNLKVETKAVDFGLATVSVKCEDTPVENANVTVGTCSGYTDENGQVQIALPYGTYSVEAGKLGYEGANNAGGNATASLTVDSATEVIELVLVEADTGIYIDESFDGYATGQIIKTGTAEVPSVEKGQLTFNAGFRSGGAGNNYIETIAESDGDNAIKIVTERFADTEARGLSFDFIYPREIPTVEELRASGEMLELSMDINTTGAVTIEGFGAIPKDTNGHVRLIMDGANNKKYMIVTDATGKLLNSTEEALANTTTFTKATFYVNGMVVTIDNLKVEKKEVNVGTATVTVKSEGAALEGASVMIGEQVITTDAEGSAVFVLPNGTYSVEASKAGYEFTAGAADSAIKQVTVESEAIVVELNLQQMVYISKPTKVIISDGQTYIEAPATAESASTEAFSLVVEDQMDVVMDAEDYTVEWSVVNVTTNAEDPNVTISDAGVVSVAKEFMAENLAQEYLITAKVSANGEEASGKIIIFIGNSGVDYANAFNKESDIITSVEQGSDIDQYAPKGAMELTYVSETDEDGYMQIYAKGTGNRGSRFDLNSGIIKGAEINFDWMVNAKNDHGFGEIFFISPGTYHPYLTLRFDEEHQIVAFTENRLGEACSTQPSESFITISKDNAIESRLKGKDKWYSVNVEFDYLQHTAVFTVVDKANPENTFTSDTINIEETAAGISTMLFHMQREIGDDNTVTAEVKMGMDNLVVSYVEFDGGDIVDVVNPEDVFVNKTDLDDFVRPTTVTVITGDGGSVEVPVKGWTSTPTFDDEVEGEYIWTTELENGNLTNLRGLNATFKMTYTMLPYPFYVHNPNTVELEFGEAMPSEFPTEVVAFMSDGTIGTMAVGEWTAIREFNPDVEGIYVYGANLVATPGKDQIVREQLNRNENHDDHGSDKAAYVYDVYYRISNFKSDDNYNAYTRSMEYLDRGVYAVAADNGIFVSWRLLVTEYGEDISFNIYRNGELVNAQPITSKTNYVDVNGKAGDSYTVVKLQDGLQYESEAFVAIDKEYLSIPMQKPAAMPSKTGEMAEYTLNDAGVADVDGDGQYEVIVKWYPTNSFDSGKAVKPSSPTIFDVYEMDGTPLWRLNLGLELPSGAHFNQFMFYDLDEDGKAELFIKTSDGTISYRPNAEGKFDMTDESTVISYIGDRSVIPGTNVMANGHMANTTNEYVTVFNGMTGEEIDTIDYINKVGDLASWGDTTGNRSARFNIAIAYLPANQDDASCTETIPAVLFNRGYYARTTVAAYTLRNGEITLEWNLDVPGGDRYAEKGNHNMSTGDMDNDGFDELVIGAMAIDHDGSVLWAKDAEEGRDFSGHADAIHLAAMMPDTNQLYVVVPSENTTSTLNYSVTNAATGVRIAGQFMTKADIGRGMAANITPNAGYEYWANVPNSEIANQAPSGAIYNIYGGVIAQEKPVNFTTNWRLFWDGDLLSELPDSYNPSVGEGAMSIFKYNWETKAMDTLTTFTGTKLNNATKNNPSLTADLFGDWREEVMLRSEDSSELRIYLTSEETDYMIYTLMHDPVYRNCVANQNTAYNQPPQIGFYLGEDNKDTVLAMGLPTANIAYTVEEPEGTEDKDEPAATPTPTPSSTATPVPEATTAPTAAPEVTAAPTAAPTSAPVVTQAPSSGSSDSDHIVIDENVDWREVTDVIANITTDDYTVVDIDLGRYNMLSSEVLSAIQGRNITISITQDNGVEFRINGRDVESARDMNLRVILDSGVFNAERLTPFVGYNVRQITLEHDGNFGFTATVRIPTDSANNGKYANLFWDNNGRFEFQGSSKITDGYAAFAFTHASDYVMVVSENPLAVKSPTTGDELIIVERSNNYGAVLGVLAFLAIAAYGAGMVILKKKEEN